MIRKALSVRKLATLRGLCRNQPCGLRILVTLRRIAGPLGERATVLQAYGSFREQQNRKFRGTSRKDAPRISLRISLSSAGRAGGVGPFVVDLDFRVTYAVGHRFLARIAGFAQANFLDNARLF